jgi:hypothetical protein
MRISSTTLAALSAIAVTSLAFVPLAYAGEEHGHCSGANVCQGDAACEKQGFKELTKEECAKVEGAAFAESKHEGENHKDAPHDHDHEKK